MDKKSSSKHIEYIRKDRQASFDRQEIVEFPFPRTKYQYTVYQKGLFLYVRPQSWYRVEGMA